MLKNMRPDYLSNISYSFQVYSRLNHLVVDFFSLFEYINNTERNLTAEDVLMSYDSTTSSQRVQVPCYTSKDDKSPIYLYIR